MGIEVAESGKNRMIAENVRRILGELPAGVTLLAASKTRTPEEIAAARAAGVSCFGENRVQELLEKYEQCAYAGTRLDFIGTLQSNKAKQLVGKVSLIHSVSTEAALSAISREAEKQSITQDILIELNCGEESKSGIPMGETESFVSRAASMKNVRVRGLMTVPPVGTDPEPYFVKVRGIYDALRGAYGMDTLSMGMSHDYLTAARCGATIVRVGTAIFGPRDYGNMVADGGAGGVK